MRRRHFIRSSAVIGTATALSPADAAARWAFARETAHRRSGTSRRLDTGWRFLRGDPAGAERAAHGDFEWESVILPHTARVEALVTGDPASPTYQWQGVAWYRRDLDIPADAAGKRVLLKFEGAMNVADVFLDGDLIEHHLGGFLPFVLDITERVAPGRAHVLAVRLDNTDNPVTGPKPLPILDFNMYGGLYRHVHLIVQEPVHITDPILADEPASGGVFVTYPEASAERAVVQVRTYFRNDSPTAHRVAVRTTIHSPDGQPVASQRASGEDALRPSAERTVDQRLEVPRPDLWSPASPALYTVLSELVVDGAVVDSEETRIGIRRIGFERDAFVINGERMFLRGTNRHQEYPYVGYALSDAAQYRDAWLIKNAGFDYVRLSHYPHSPAFMDACDELGLVVMNCIPGWQYFGEDPAFAELQYRNTRELIRRDRNHPCVVLWEVSLNETAMPPEFIETTQRIAHEEYPGDQMFTCGWMPGYDVFIRARQHGGCPEGEAQPCVVSEYGDWEYYAMTAGLNQEEFQSLTADEQNSRQLRWHGERAMLQQATNFQEAHDDNLAGPAFGDGLWVMFDYNRGYAPDIESSGCMDIFRLPKYSFHFYRSQRDASLGEPMVFIASEWTAESSTRVRVFSNCDEVELRLNGRIVARRRPDRDRISQHVAHPPFTFDVGAFEPGELRATGYTGGVDAAAHAVTTPGPIARLVVHTNFDADTRGKDLILARASFQDANTRVVPSAWENVVFGIVGDARLIGANPFSSDAGIASIVVETMPNARSVAVYALAIVGGRVLSAAWPVVGEPSPAHDAHATARGAEIRVAGRLIASLDRDAPRFRVRGSEAPERRDPFRHG